MAKFEVSMMSHTLKRGIDLTVVIPSVTYPDVIACENEGKAVTQKISDKYPVLYLLHGFSGDHHVWTGYANTEMYAEERKIAVVMLSGENKAYQDHEPMDLFYDFIESELQDFIKTMFPVSDRVEDTYIAGLSMGGYGTLIHALGNPQKYHAFGAFSAGVQNRRGPKILQNEVMDLIEYNHENKIALPKGYISCGCKDHLYEDDKKVFEKLNEYGYDVTWSEDPRYAHEWRFWDQEIEAFLDWIPRTDAWKDVRTSV
ncbi:MAG: alpha/beta hydrolase-fold protein [Clostridia bacterium]|nr:alpha/beta hydrolase-fold protein [Clostridia bacterium]